MLRRLKAIANSPWTPVVLVMYFALDGWCLIRQFDRGEAMTPVGMISFQIRDSLGMQPGIPPNYHGYAYSTTFDLPSLPVQPTEPSNEGTIDLAAYFHAARRFQCNVITKIYSYGWYAPTRRQRYARRTIFASGLATRQEVHLLKESAKKYLLESNFGWNHPDHLVAALVSARANYKEQDILPLGYLHNALSLSMFAMLSWSLRFNIPKLWRKRDPTKCPHCGYSTIGLTTSTCPECGHALMKPRA